MNLSKKPVQTIILLILFAAGLLMVAMNPLLVPKIFLLIITPFTPLFIGIVIALFVNPALNFFENIVFRFWKKKTSLRRIISLILAFLLFFGILTSLIILVFPSISDSLVQIANNASDYVETLREFLNRWNLPSEFLPTITNNGISGIIEFIQTLMHVNPETSNFFSRITQYASSLFSATFTGILGFIFSIYILIQKEHVIYFFARLCHALFPERFYRKCTEIAKFSSKTISNFITGQLLHALLFGILMLVIMLITNIPYAVLNASLIAVFALVPYIGAFVSAAVAAILILTVSPFKAILFIVLYLVTQQIDDHVIYPKFVGKSVGVPGLIVLLAVTTGSAIGGVLGMVFMVPVVAVLYHYTLQFIEYRLAKRAQKIETPISANQAQQDPIPDPQKEQEES